MRRPTLVLLRFPFSIFLLPVFLFALSQVPHPVCWRTILVFVIWHLLIYPSSNGYNSYMDRDAGPIGGLKSPPPPPRALWPVTLAMDGAALALALLVSLPFAACCLIYISLSRAYSSRSVRLKRYPLAGYATVTVCQGALVFFATYHGCSLDLTLAVPWVPALASSLLIGGFYPLTQIYQHEQDRRDGVRTLSAVLGYTGTFAFCAVVYAVALGLLAWYFLSLGQLRKWLLVQAFFLPVLVYFLAWFLRVRKDRAAADHAHAMRMNWIASLCTNAVFTTLFIWTHFE